MNETFKKTVLFRFCAPKVYIYFIKVLWNFRFIHVGFTPIKFEYHCCKLRGSTEKFLARPTSRCRRTELIVSSERWVCSCAELQVFSCYRGWKEACEATRAISRTSRRELSSSSPPHLQGKSPKEIDAILIETLSEHAPSYATVKNWVAQYWSNSRANLGRPLDFG